MRFQTRYISRYKQIQEVFWPVFLQAFFTSFFFLLNDAHAQLPSLSHLQFSDIIFLRHWSQQRVLSHLRLRISLFTFFLKVSVSVFAFAKRITCFLSNCRFTVSDIKKLMLLDSLLVFLSFFQASATPQSMSEASPVALLGRVGKVQTENKQQICTIIIIYQ